MYFMCNIYSGLYRLSARFDMSLDIRRDVEAFFLKVKAIAF